MIAAVSGLREQSRDLVLQRLGTERLATVTLDFDGSVILDEIAPKIGDPLCLGCYLDSFDLLMSNPMAAPAGAAIGFAVFSWAH